ncbi:MAG: DNA primase small subunit domain-containing protein [Nanoarchaeota archaeon]
MNSFNPYFDYYSRKEIQSKIVSAAKNKEIGVLFHDGNFGKRPDVLQYDNDILELVKQGAYSFHISEETWQNPLMLKSGMSKKDLDDLRIGWDLVLDTDSKHLEYSRIATLLVIEAIKFHNIKNIDIKFSGNHGFHIGIHFRAFPDRVNNLDTKLLFPEGLRIIAMYIKYLIKDHLASELLKHNLDDIAKNTGKEKEALFKDGKFDSFSVVDIDTILISSRHLFRAAYSINEKSGLVSVPITLEQLKNFSLEMADPKSVSTELNFLDQEKFEQGEARHLIMQAFDFAAKTRSIEPELKIQGQKNYEDSIDKIPQEFFPGCIKKLLAGNLNDGRKRALFILINFLKSTNYNKDEIRSILNEWNSKNPVPLKQGYINTQLLWHERQNKKILPPNCDNDNYYRSLGVKDPDEYCSKCKNPVNCASRAYRNSKNFQRNKGKNKG